jgi:hypothetical protein
MFPANARQDMLKRAVIPPEDAADEGPMKQTRIVIDSRDRDTVLYPNPNQYVVVLPDDIPLVTDVALQSAWFPFSAPQINATNNKFAFRMLPGGAWNIVTIPPGDYDSQDGNTVFQTELNRLVPGGGFEVTVNPVTDTYVFQHDTNNFEFDFSNANFTAKKPLGFGSRVYTSQNRMLMAPFRRDLNEYNRYVILDLDAIDPLVSANEAINRSFAVLYKHKIQAGLDHSSTKHFSIPIAKLSKFNVSIIDRNGNPYDSQNQDHVIELLVTHHPSTRKNW